MRPRAAFAVCFTGVVLADTLLAFTGRHSFVVDFCVGALFGVVGMLVYREIVR